MTHLVATPGDRRSLCGVKDPLPRVWAAKAQRHVDGYGMIVCAECEAKPHGVNAVARIANTRRLR